MKDDSDKTPRKFHVIPFKEGSVKKENIYIHSPEFIIWNTPDGKTPDNDTLKKWIKEAEDIGDYEHCVFLQKYLSDYRLKVIDSDFTP